MRDDLHEGPSSFVYATYSFSFLCVLWRKRLIAGTCGHKFPFPTLPLDLVFAFVSFFVFVLGVLFILLYIFSKLSSFPAHLYFVPKWYRSRGRDKPSSLLRDVLTVSTQQSICGPIEDDLGFHYIVGLPLFLGSGFLERQQ